MDITADCGSAVLGSIPGGSTGHTPSQVTREGVLFFNPGAFGVNFVTGKRSVGVLDLGETMVGEIVYL